MMTELQTEKDYWDHAAKDPDVEQKFIANISLDLCLEQIIPELKPFSVLEIGCGIGRLTTAIANRLVHYQVHGIDISSAMLDQAPKSTVKYRVGNGRSIPYADQSFDSVYSILVFQHIPARAKEGYIKEAWRVLKKGGVFRFQYVEGEHHGDIDHNATADQVLKWLEDAGFTIASFDKRIIFENWSWVTAIKEGKT